MFGSIRSFVVGAVVCGALVAFSGTAAIAAPPWLGLEVEPTADHSGAKISEILPESPLAAAGVRGAVQRGDVVQSVAGVPVRTPSELVARVRMLQVGQRVLLKVRSEKGKVSEVPVVLGERIPPEALQVKALQNLPAPDFTAQWVLGAALPTTAAGGVMTALRGTPVLLDFFATWCGPCMAAMPRMIELSQKYPRLRIIGLSDEPLETIRPIMGQFQPPYSVARDEDRKAYRAYRVFSFPTMILVDAGGTVRVVSHGNLPQIEAALEALMQAPPSLPGPGMPTTGMSAGTAGAKASAVGRVRQPHRGLEDPEPATVAPTAAAPSQTPRIGRRTGLGPPPAEVIHTPRPPRPASLESEVSAPEAVPTSGPAPAPGTRRGGLPPLSPEVVAPRQR